MRIASANDGAPTGATMNSWKSTGLSACTPPLSTFIVGTGSSGIDVAGERLVQIAPQRLPGVGGRGARRGHRDAEDRVGAQARLAVGAVEVDQRLIQATLIGRLETRDRCGDLAVDMGDRASHALAAERGLSVAQLERLARSGRRARRHGGPARGAGRQPHVDLDGRVAAAVEDLRARTISMLLIVSTPRLVVGDP